MYWKVNCILTIHLLQILLFSNTYIIKTIIVHCSYKFIKFYFILFIYFIKQRPKSQSREVGTHQHQRKRKEGKKRKKNKEKERDHNTEDGPPKPIPSNWWAHRGWRKEWKTEGKREKQEAGSQPRTIQSPPTTCRDHMVSQIKFYFKYIQRPAISYFICRNVPIKISI